MAQRKIAGNDVLLMLDTAGGTSYGTVVCLTSNSFEIVNNIIDAKSKCGPDTLPGTVSYNSDFEGQVIYSPSGSNVGIYDLLVAAQSQATCGFKISQATPVTGDVTITGTCFLGSVKQVFGDEAPSTFTATLGIYGTPTITEVP